MAESGKKKIFISWSKKQSGEVASVLKRRLRFILEGVEIFMSQSDITPGERSMRAIEAELDHSSFGILVVTKRNSSEPWLNFEAGALSKAVGNDAEGKPRVVPLLVDLTSGGQLRGPIGQFQAVTASREGLLTLVQSIGKLVDMDAETVQDRFDAVCEPMLAEIAAIEAEPEEEEPASSTETDRSVPEMLYEALEILRSQQQSAVNVNLSSDEQAKFARIIWRAKQSDRRRLERDVIEEAALKRGLKISRLPPERDDGREIILELPPYSKGSLSDHRRIADLEQEMLANGIDMSGVVITRRELDRPQQED